MFKLMLVRFDRDIGRFDDEEFNKFCTNNNIVRIDKEFINTGGEIYYSFFIEYHPKKPVQSKPDLESLSELARAQYEKLRDWRNELAANEGIPASSQSQSMVACHSDLDGTLLSADARHPLLR